MSDDASERVALITGAARGIGRAICQAFVNEGASVILTDIASAQGKETAVTIGARFLPLDVPSMTGGLAR